MSATYPPGPGIYLRNDRTDAGRRIVVGLDGEGVQVLRFIVPDGVPFHEARLPLESVLSLHRPRLRSL